MGDVLLAFLALCIGCAAVLVAAANGYRMLVRRSAPARSRSEAAHVDPCAISALAAWTAPADALPAGRRPGRLQPAASTAQPGVHVGLDSGTLPA